MPYCIRWWTMIIPLAEDVTAGIQLKGYCNDHYCQWSWSEEIARVIE